MPRRPRVVAPGVPHHITQRGNDRQKIFHSDRDWTMYLEVLGHHTAENQVRILGYCLMSNHVHLVAVPECPGSLARVLRGAHSDYATRWNRCQGRSGHVWQGRFFSCPLDQMHLVAALRYVDLNPVRAGLVDAAAEWAWSSARVHTVPGSLDPLLGGDWTEWFGKWDYAEWKRLLTCDDETDRGWDELRRSTANGSPLGSAEFIKQLEKKEGRRLQVLERGRPRKRGGADGIPGLQLGLF